MGKPLSQANSCTKSELCKHHSKYLKPCMHSYDKDLLSTHYRLALVYRLVGEGCMSLRNSHSSGPHAPYFCLLKQTAILSTQSLLFGSQHWLELVQRNLCLPRDIFCRTHRPTLQSLRELRLGLVTCGLSQFLPTNL